MVIVGRIFSLTIADQSPEAGVVEVVDVAVRLSPREVVPHVLRAEEGHDVQQERRKHGKMARKRSIRCRRWRKTNVMSKVRPAIVS